MTRIDFHFNAPDKLHYACRIVRKAHAAGQPVVVYCSDTERLHQFDQTLWSFSPLDFLPHCYAHEPLAAQTPILLTSTANGQLPIHEILINLDDHWPPFFSEFERLIEVVGCEDSDRAQGRERYKFYRDRGYALNNYDQAAQ